MRPDSPDENRGELRDVMRLGEKTVEQLVEAQKAALKASVPLVRPDVWAAALKAADGDTARIMIHGPTEVYVVNTPGEKPPWLE